MLRILLRYSLFIGCLGLFAVFLIWPIMLLLSRGFEDVSAQGSGGYTLRHILGVFADPVLRVSLFNSLKVAIGVTICCLALALPLAILSTKFDFPGKTIFSSLVLVPMILPPFVGAIGMRHLLGRFGGLSSLLVEMGIVGSHSPPDFLGAARFWGVVIMEALCLYPIVYLNVTAALANLDPTLEQAAENLGAGRWTRLRRVILPLIMPGVFAGCTIVFIWSFTELGTPLMFDYYAVAPVQIFWGLQEAAVSPRPYALVAVVLMTAVLMYALSKWIFGGRAYAMNTRSMTLSTTQRVSGVRGLVILMPFIVVTLLAVMPHMGVILTSFAEPGSWYQSVIPQQLTTRHYAGALTHDLASGSIRNSLFYASLAMLVDLFLGVLIAYLVVRTKIRGRQLLDSLAMLPLAVPGLVMAFGFVAMTLQWPFPQLAQYFTAWGWEGLASLCAVTGQAPNPLVFLVIAYAIRRLPYVVRAAVSGLQQTNVELEQAAMNLGASRLLTIRKVVLPLIAANLIAGGLLAFSFALLEVSDSLILALREQHYPITKAIYTLFRRLGDGPYVASAMGVWGMALLTTTLMGASLMLGKKLGSLFRV
ncbi:MAG: hypothetical protein HJJLKODD_02745 [Phycisphaerae bacterium]|nr:hypothetical protein [Phycisphaerae bacterium]